MGGLKYHEDNFEEKISVSSKAVSEIQWWINSIDNSSYHVNDIPNPDITIHRFRCYSYKLVNYQWNIPVWRSPA